MKGNIIHLLNRGVEKRKVFIKEKDYIRFTHNLYDFNDVNDADQSYYVRRKQNPLNTDMRCPYLKEQLIDVLCWTLMPNHPHLLVHEKTDSGASKFSRKVFGGYTKYFNEQNDRSGVLFQGRTKIIHVERDAHFLYLPFYIHLNPLDLFQPGWKEDGIKDIKGAINFIEEYRWSNYRDIIGKGNSEFADITSKELFFELFQTNEKEYKKDLEEWIKNKGYQEDFTNFE